MENMSNREKMHEILDMVIDTNGLRDRKKGLTGYLPTVFFEFSGHVATLRVTVFPDGWESGADGKDFVFDTTRPFPEKKVEALRKCLYESLDDNDAAQVLVREISEKEKEIEKKRMELTQLKKELTKVRKEGGAA